MYILLRHRVINELSTSALYSFWRTLLVIVFKSKIDSFYLMVIIVDI